MDAQSIVSYIRCCFNYDELVLINEAITERMRTHDWAFFQCKEQFESTYPDFKLDKFTHEHHGYHETEDHYKINITHPERGTMTISYGDCMGDEYLYYNYLGMEHRGKIIDDLPRPYAEMVRYLIRNFD